MTDTDTTEKKERKLAEVVEMVEESELSSIKGTISGIVDIINNPRSNAKDLKEVIQVDPPLTAKVMRIANSAFYASPRNISEIDQAVIWIGFDTLKEIALSQKVCEIFQVDSGIRNYSRSMLWKHSLAVALLAKLIFRREFGERGENAYAAGLMHDIGIIVEDQFFREDFSRMIANEGELAKKEFSTFGYTHADIGRSLTDHWGLPDDMVAAIGHHHDVQGVLLEHARLAKTLYIADCLSHESQIGYSSSVCPNERLLERYMNDLKLQSFALKSLVKLMKEDLKQMEDKGFFEV